MSSEEVKQAEYDNLGMLVLDETQDRSTPDPRVHVSRAASARPLAHVVGVAMGCGV